ncbi:hypothetical protein [Leadbettera azotonutricia]|uniref:Uncharacterized protein n=1 Tax=Leadbettera azotonutricia (strain ATCC BAA-888 / DSM 13862 / ZAS-9) TaxID=545695 RepID=F5YBI2_LEAAZ|nr:hypothetical protein [Leadbettera azotonutricia]AEF83000.1 hypothetical protein TREAZ_0603 [Leadbettera azotonutricia ZAS-9]
MGRIIKKLLKKSEKGMKYNTLLVLEKGVEALSQFNNFLKVAEGPEDKKKAIIEKTDSLMADIQEFIAAL